MRHGHSTQTRGLVIETDAETEIKIQRGEDNEELQRSVLKAVNFLMNIK